MLIIVEGPDCAGKSTLVDGICRRLEEVYPERGVRRLHASKPTAPTFLDEYLTPLLDYRPTSQHVVCDRWHVGEVVYPAVFGRDTIYDPLQWAYLEAYLRARGALVVHLSAPTAMLTERLRQRGDDLVTEAMLEPLRAGFFHARDLSSLTWCDASNLFTNVADILRDAKRQEWLASPLGEFRTYVGSPIPRRLLVGDIRGKLQGDDDRPAFAPVPGTSGHYLWRAIGGAVGAFTGVANANDVDDIEKLYVALGQPNDVVGLGRLAQRKLASLGIAHAAAPHPQYVRRFHHRRLTDYRDQLLGRKDSTWSFTSPTSSPAT